MTLRDHYPRLRRLEAQYWLYGSLLIPYDNLEDENTEAVCTPIACFIPRRSLVSLLTIKAH